MFRLFLTSTLVISIAGCATVPPYVINGDNSSVAPSGPKVASLIAHLKCELYNTANSREPLTYYRDDPSLSVNVHYPTDNRQFNLKNYFEEIEYVAEAELTLDVTGNSSLNPSLSFINPYTAMTNFTFTVGGQLSENAHRFVNIYSSVDFARLVPSNPDNPKAKNSEPALATPPSTTDCDDPAGPLSNTELRGNLGLKETLASAITAAAMNDVAVFQSTDAKLTPFNIDNNYAFGLIGAQVDFTIVEDINGGPNYTLTTFKGPSGGGGGGGSSSSGSTGMSSGNGGGNQGLINLSRQLKDTLTISFVPVCIRSKYTQSPGNPPYKYSPEMIVGTPGWANYLPSCNVDRLSSVTNALNKASESNITIQTSTTPRVNGL